MEYERYDEKGKDVVEVILDESDREELTYNGETEDIEENWKIIVKRDNA